MSRRLIGAGGGLVVWSIHFVVVYALVGVGCEQGWNLRPLLGSNALTVWLIAATVPALAAIAWIAWAGARGVRHWHRESIRAAPQHQPATEMPIGEAKRWRFLAALTLALAVVAFVATAMTAVPIFMLPPCQ
jgi:hypothetical protein